MKRRYANTYVLSLLVTILVKKRCMNSINSQIRDLQNLKQTCNCRELSQISILSSHSVSPLVCPPKAQPVQKIHARG